VVHIFKSNKIYASVNVYCFRALFRPLVTQKQIYSSCRWKCDRW